MRGVDFPAGPVTITGVVGVGGPGGAKEHDGGNGGNTTRAAIPSGKAAMTAVGGLGATIYSTEEGNSIGHDGTVVVETMLTHTSGEWVRSELALPLAKHDPQGVGSAVTYGRRYGLAAIIGVVADVDDDANHASGKTNAPNNVAKMPPVKLPAADAGNAALIDALRETCKALNDAGDEIKWSPIEITMFANNMFGDEKNFTGRSAEQLNTLGEELAARLNYITKQAAATTKAAKSGGAK